MIDVWPMTGAVVVRIILPLAGVGQMTCGAALRCTGRGILTAGGANICGDGRTTDFECGLIPALAAMDEAG